MGWTSASKGEVQEAVEADWIGIDHTLKTRLVTYLVEPEPALIQRFGKMENAFIVARLNDHVVFFDDIEEDFGIAREADGSLVEATAYGNIALALSEMEQLGLNDR